jgi:DNA excision repair protein ERCC-4
VHTYSTILKPITQIRQKRLQWGADDDPEVGAGINAAAEELLRCLPGITTKNVKYVMSNVRELCGMSLIHWQVQVLGVEPGRACFDFMHKGEK